MRMLKYTIVAILTALCSAVWAQSPKKPQLLGVGGTFALPVYAKWFEAYGETHPAWDVRYLPMGSGEGIRQITAGVVDFAGSDGPMTDKQLADAKVKILHFPSVVGAVVPIYNLPGMRDRPLRFTPETLAGIFLGTVRKWNDPAISGDNPGIKLPSAEIIVIHRAGGSGTTYVWTDYLSKVSAPWRSQVGRGTEVSWPVGQDATGNEGLTDKVTQTPYAIGYAELAYVVRSGVSYGVVRNAAGNFVEADVKSIAAAVAAAATMPDDFRVSITNAPGKRAYPIASFTWLLVPAEIHDAKKKTAVQELLRWVLTDGQNESVESQLFARLPAEVVKKELKAVEQIH